MDTFGSRSLSCYQLLLNNLLGYLSRKDDFHCRPKPGIPIISVGGFPESERSDRKREKENTEVESRQGQDGFAEVSTVKKEREK